METAECGFSFTLTLVVIGLVEQGEQNDQYIYALDLARKLNLCLNDYYEKTQNISQLLQEQHEDDIFGLGGLINLREAIILQYNTLLKEYQSLETTASLKEFGYLEEQRNKVLGLIKELDSYNLSRVNDLYNTYKKRIKQIYNGKKIINAYNHTGPLSDGFFIDKRK